MTTASILTPCQRFFQHAFNLLIERAQTCIRHATQRAAEPTATPKQLRAPDRANTTMDWIIALARTLAGSSKYLIPWRIPRFKPLHVTRNSQEVRDALRKFGAIPTPTEASRYQARLRYMKKVFATQATGIIAARLAGRLGISKDSDYWPADLIAITQTPVQWARENPPGPDPRDEPAPQPAIAPTEPASQSQPATTNSAPDPSLGPTEASIPASVKNAE